jgi:hypothetical protein
MLVLCQFALCRSAVAQGDSVAAIAQWALGGDARGRPFVVVDKPNARLFVFASDGALLGSTAVLLGLTRGDAPATPGIAARLNTTGIPIEQRTTPAGRFDALPAATIVGSPLSGSTTAPRWRSTACARRRQRNCARNVSPRRRRTTTASRSAASSSPRSSSTR